MRLFLVGFLVGVLTGEVTRRCWTAGRFDRVSSSWLSGRGRGTGA